MWISVRKLWGCTLVILPKFRAGLLAELHSTHIGTVKVKSVARSYTWWPGIQEIKKVTKICRKCLVHSKNLSKSVLHQWLCSEESS